MSSTTFALLGLAFAVQGCALEDERTEPGYTELNACLGSGSGSGSGSAQCRTESDCADHNACTTDACVAGQCRFTAALHEIRVLPYADSFVMTCGETRWLFGGPGFGIACELDGQGQLRIDPGAFPGPWVSSGCSGSPLTQLQCCFNP